MATSSMNRAMGSGKQDCKPKFIQVLYAIAKDPDISGLTFSEDPKSENSLILKVRV